MSRSANNLVKDAASAAGNEAVYGALKAGSSAMVPSWQQRCAARVLRAGGLVLHAAEGVWGLACDPDNAAAVARLLQVKQRELDKGLVLIGADEDAFAPELAQLPAADREQILATWPGAVTWVLPNRRFALWITGEHTTVAVRVPGHPQARGMAQAFGGPLVSTSANRSGFPPPTQALQARRHMAHLVDYVLPGHTLGRGSASEIRTLAGARLR